MKRALFAATLAASLSPSCSGRKTAQPPTGPALAATFAEFASEEVRQAAQTYPDIAVAIEPPVSLTASDGQGLVLVKMTGRSVVDGPLAFTELHLRFLNPEDRVREGRFSITLPDGAAISRLAMMIDGAWQEAEVVERQLAQQAYEDFLHRRQDPALLEKEAGNQFSARIFPIPARSEKDIIVSYSNVIDRADGALRIPLRGLPEIADLDLEVMVRDPRGATKSTSLRRQGFVPDADFEVSVGNAAAGLRNQRLAAIRIAPALTSAMSAISAMTILFDTSASRAPGYARSVEELGALVAELRAVHGDGLALTVVAFDQETQVIHRGPASEFGADQLRVLRARRPLGASDLSRAFADLAALSPRGRLLLIGDAVATAGATGAGELKEALAKLRGFDRFDVVVSGGIRDREMAAALTAAFASNGALIAGESALAERARRIGLATAAPIRVSIEGARWTWPETFDGMQAGDEVVVFAELRAAAPAKLTIKLDGGHRETLIVTTAPAVAPLLTRSVAAAEIARLSAQRAEIVGAQSGEKREALKQQIVAISTANRVLSDFTALLVLETEDDYARFGIDRKALGDIMTVGKSGVVLTSRAAPVFIARPEADLPDKTKGQGDESPMTQEDKKLEETATKADGPPPAKPVESEFIDTRQFSGASDDLDDDDDDEGGVEFISEGHGSGSGASAGDAAGRGEYRRPAQVADRDGDSVLDLTAPEPEPQIDEFAQNLASSPPAYTGEMATVMSLVDANQTDKAIAAALAWQTEHAGDVMALVALGSALERAGNPRIAARAYGSIIDLFPSRADLRRFAGARIARLAGGSALAIDTFKVAVSQRPDHLTSHRLLAYALVRAGRLEEAFDAITAGLAVRYPDGRFEGGLRILGEDMAIIAAAWRRAEPKRAADIESRAKKHGVAPSREPSLRFVLNWETDANDVDFHIYDGKGGHAYYSQRQLPSGGDLYADVTTGYGPECFAIPGKAKAFPYRLQIHYYSRGPMGYGMGQVEILAHDGNGNLTFQERPFVVMNDGAYLDLGEVRAP